MSNNVEIKAIDTMDSQKVSVNIVDTDNVTNEEQWKISHQIFDIMLNNILFGYENLYQKEDYSLLLHQIGHLVNKNEVMKFFLPAFPVKSPNKDKKVLGVYPDFAESIAIDNLLRVARKIETVYDAGTKIIIMSDYHTFDQYIQVDEESYKIYHQGLKDMIKNKGGDDVIELIDLSYFKEFENVPEQKISTLLAEEFGGESFKEKFDDEVKSNPQLHKKYTQQLKFFKKDLSHILTLSPNSKRKVFLKNVVTGTMSQGVALDAFLRQQKNIENYIRLSIHHHRPEAGKSAVDLFKNKCHVSKEAQLRTPWHNTVILDTSTGQFSVEFREELNKVDPDSLNHLVYHEGKPWFYVKLHLSPGVSKETLDLKISMIRYSCGMIIEATKSKGTSIDVFTEETIKTLVKEFGVVVFRGFKEFDQEDDFLSYYENHLHQKAVRWSFGKIHKVMPDKNIPGDVNSHLGLPLHWDMIAPPEYMGIDQEVHKYEDFTCPMFALYCRFFEQSNPKGNDVVGLKNEGATTFVDVSSAIQSVHGRTIEHWKDVSLKYETELAKDEKTGKKAYFGGKGNTYTHPLIHQCPNQPEKDVIRWWQSWSKEEFPKAKQYTSSMIASYPKELSDKTTEQLEGEIRKIVFDERFFFSYQYAAGDLVFVNNYTTLHGRNPFHENIQRELWRIQSQPVDMGNLPEYFK